MTSTIVVGVDASEQSRDAVALARTLARATGAGLLLVGVHPHDPLASPITGREYELAVRDDAAKAVAAAAELVAGVEFCDVRVVGDTSPPRALQAVAAEVGAAAIVVGSSRRGRLGRVLPGSTGDRLLHGAPCPVAIAPAGHWGNDRGSWSRIGVAFDGTPEARAALAAAEKLAATGSARLRIMAVAQPLRFDGTPVTPSEGYLHLDDARRTFLRTALDRAAAETSVVDAEADLLDGVPADVLAEQSKSLDLLVTGSRGYGPLGAVLAGGVVHRLATLARCPLYVIPRSALKEEAAGEPATEATVV